MRMMYSQLTLDGRAAKRKRRRLAQAARREETGQETGPDKSITVANTGSGAPRSSLPSLR